MYSFAPNDPGKVPPSSRPPQPPAFTPRAFLSSVLRSLARLEMLAPWSNAASSFEAFRQLFFAVADVPPLLDGHRVLFGLAPVQIEWPLFWTGNCNKRG